MIAPTQNNHDGLLQAYCDGALDPAPAAEFERLVASDESVRLRRNQILNLRGALQRIPEEPLPSELLSRINSAIDAESSLPLNRSWRTIAASALIGAALAASLILMININTARQEIAGQIVSNHIRGLLAPQPFDVASSDRHTVKPWFTSRIPESPRVVDLAPQGFALAGGRVDVIKRDPAATLVYRYAAHTLSLTTLRPGNRVSAESFSGYNILTWSDKEFTYVVVADLPHDDLDKFKREFISALALP